MTRWHLGLSILALVASACASPSSSRVGRSASALVGGTPTDGDPAVVAVYIGPAQACSGSIISKNTVLTAAHCAIDDALLTVPGVSIVFGKDADDFGAREINVTKWTIHPRYTAEGKGFDVALLTLEADVNDVTPLTIADVPLPDSAVGASVRHVGYGQNDEKAASGEGTKRTATYPLHKIEPLLLWSGAPGLQTCDGDSGGPALLRDGEVERIFAVVSDGPSCHDDGADARVDVKEVHDWIVETANLAVTSPSKPSAPSASSGPSDERPTSAEPSAPSPPAEAPEDNEAPAATGCSFAGSRTRDGAWAWLALAFAFAARKRARATASGERSAAPRSATEPRRCSGSP